MFFSMQYFMIPNTFPCDSQHFKFSMGVDLSADVIRHMTKHVTSR